MENCPFALVEALRAGLPVFAAPVGGIPEVLGRDGAGKFWNPDDPDAGADIVGGFLEDEAVCSEASRQARTRFANNFTVDTAGESLLRFLASATRDSSGHRIR